MEFWLELPLLFATGIWLAALNAVAGGGTFFAFPILLFLGVPPIQANATSKFAMWLGAAASIRGYWPEIMQQKDKLLFIALLASISSIAGSLLLLVTPAETFRAFVPWLMLIATLIFALGRQCVTLLQRNLTAHPRNRLAVKLVNGCSIISIGTYGGFFGAGIGILLMAYCQLVGIRDIHQANAIKVVAATGITTLSALVFMIDGTIVWPQALMLGAGTLVGGYYGATLAKKLSQRFIRGFIIVYGLAISFYFFTQ